MGKWVKHNGKWVDEDTIIREPVKELKGSELRKEIIIEPKPQPKPIDVIRSHNDIRAAIKLKRKECGKKQEHFAAEIGISHEQYSRIESGASMMRIDQMVRICDKLGLTITIF